MADSINKFHDAAERAPIGGWHYFYDPADGSTMFKLGSAEEVIDELIRFRANNGKPAGREAIAQEVWSYYCSRQPERCGQAIPAGGAVPFLPKDLTPEFFGPIIWRFLNLAAVRFEEVGRDFFLALVLRVHDMMTCPDCRQHWEEILSTNSPVGITSAKAACQWINKVHNLVNTSKGKAIYPYAKGVTEYGYPL